MRTAVMTVSIILCFTLTILAILTINSFSSVKVDEQLSLNKVVDASIKSLELDYTYNEETYEKMVNDLLQLIILQSKSNGNINIKILDANTKEGLLDVEVSKTYKWYGIKKTVSARRTVVLDEYENPPAEQITVKFIYNDGTGNLVHRTEETFVGAILKRPKNPKRTGFKFAGWSLTDGGSVITDDAWQSFDVPNVAGTEKVFYLYAIFVENTQ